jgi:hypothetical protein
MSNFTATAPSASRIAGEVTVSDTYRLILSPPPPDIVNGVAPIGDSARTAPNGNSSHTAATADPAAAMGLDVEAALRLSPPPPDIVDGVAPIGDVPAAVPVPAAAAALERDADLPPDLHDVDYAQLPDSAPIEFESRPTTIGAPLSNEQAFRIASAVAPAWSGADRWAAISLDREFGTAQHPAAGSRHFGLGFGLLLFTQESGLLGRMLRLFQQRDPEVFAETFGPDASALLATLTAATAAERLAPVAGSLLWQGDLPARFRAAAATPPCIFAQNEVAVESVVRPAAVTCLQVGLDTDRGVAMATDLVVAAGVGGGLRSLLRLAAPFTSTSELDGALSSIGLPDIPALQALADVPRTNVWDVPTVTALIARRRAAGLDRASSGEIQGRIVSRSAGARRSRLVALQASADLDDRVLTTASD